MLLAARDAKVRRVVYAASSSAYGNSARLPKSEGDPTAPLSPYAVAKLAGEHYCAAFSEVYGLETVRLRYFNVFGPRQTPDSPYAAVIPLFIRALTTGESPVIHGDGEQSRDFTYVADVVQANLRAATAPGVSGRVYNVACGRRTSLLELVGMLNGLLGTRHRADAHGPARRRREAQPGGHRAGEGGPRLPAHDGHERGVSSVLGVVARPERMSILPPGARATGPGEPRRSRSGLVDATPKKDGRDEGWTGRRRGDDRVGLLVHGHSAGDLQAVRFGRGAGVLPRHAAKSGSGWASPPSSSPGTCCPSWRRR